ncbi:CrcB family protein [Niallia circulans]
MIGSFTTLSTLSLDTVQLLIAGSPVPAISYVVGSAVFGISFAYLGMKIGERKWSKSNG